MPSDLDRGACRHKPSGQVPAYRFEGPGLKSASDRDSPDSPRPISVGAAGSAAHLACPVAALGRPLVRYARTTGWLDHRPGVFAYKSASNATDPRKHAR